MWQHWLEHSMNSWSLSEDVCLWENVQLLQRKGSISSNFDVCVCVMCRHHQPITVLFVAGWEIWFFFPPCLILHACQLTVEGKRQSAAIRPPSWSRIRIKLWFHSIHKHARSHAVQSSLIFPWSAKTLAQKSPSDTLHYIGLNKICGFIFALSELSKSHYYAVVVLL